MDNAAIAHAIFDAAEAGDVEKFSSYFSADAVSWHNFDQAEMPMTEAAEKLRELMQIMESVTYAERRYLAIAGGAILQHTTTAVLRNGHVLHIPTMARLYIDAGKVQRMEEYFDSRQAGM